MGSGGSVFPILTNGATLCRLLRRLEENVKIRVQNAKLRITRSISNYRFAISKATEMSTEGYGWTRIIQSLRGWVGCVDCVPRVPPAAIGIQPLPGFIEYLLFHGRTHRFAPTRICGPGGHG